MSNPTCSVDDCPKPARSPRATLCAMHYHRWYRHGSVERSATASSISASPGRRYVSLYLPGHPLAGTTGKVYAHRAVLYAAIGGGAHACHWCSAPVRWDATRGEAECLNVDHLNGLGDDNRTENLVPSCPGCNTTRGTQARSRALRDAGWWSKNDTIARLRKSARRAPIETARPPATSQLLLFE